MNFELIYQTVNFMDYLNLGGSLIKMSVSRPKHLPSLPTLSTASYLGSLPKFCIQKRYYNR